MNFNIKSSDIVFRGKVFDVKLDKIQYDESGNDGVREVAIHPGGAVVLPVTKDNKIVMVTQFRYPFGKKLLELPAGKLEEDEHPLECAKRELTEETGYSTENFLKLGKIFTTPGFCTEELHIYLAKDLNAGEHSREEGEYGMEIFKLSLNEIEEKINSGEICDAKTICGIYYYKNLILAKA